jgi:hypothetical protein
MKTLIANPNQQQQKQTVQMYNNKTNQQKHQQTV